jgi:ABC-2 type transport system permease protein
MELNIPGLTAMAVITNSYANVVVLLRLEIPAPVEEMLISPIPNYIIRLGFIAGGERAG